MTNTVFAHFQSTDCGKNSAAVAINPSQVDFFPPMTFAGISYVEVDEAAKFALARTDRTAAECQGACDSYDYTIISDADGSITGTANRCVCVCVHCHRWCCLSHGVN